MPYVVTQAEFLEAGPQALKAGRPEGTMWVVQFDDPLPALDRVTYKSVITDPLQAYVEALRPEVESGQMDFVVNYIVSWRNATRDTFEISPTLIRLYLDGVIGIRELSRRMVSRDSRPGTDHTRAAQRPWEFSSVKCQQEWQQGRMGYRTHGRARGVERWGGQDLNLRPTDYESAALTD